MIGITMLALGFAAFSIGIFTNISEFRIIGFIWFVGAVVVLAMTGICQ